MHQTAAYRAPNEDEAFYRVIDALEEETDKAVLQVALNWLLPRPIVAAVLFGAQSVEQQRGKPGSLSEVQMKRLDEASAIAPLYPH